MPAKKQALGRGLDALLGVDEFLDGPGFRAQGLHNLPIAYLKPNPFQPRHRFDTNSLEELAASIQENGILQPLVVRKAAGKDYEIVAGERRWRAAQRLGMSEIPAIVREFDDEQMIELALIENLQRDDLNPLDEARAYRQLIEEFGLTQENVAQKVGKSRVAVTNSLRLLRLPGKILGWIEEGLISAGHARALLTLDNESLQVALSREIMNKGLSVREAENRVRRLLKSADPRPKAKKPEISIDTQDLEEKLCLHLGLQVKIIPKSNTHGMIEVYYSSLDEFSRFFDHLGISMEQEL